MKTEIKDGHTCGELGSVITAAMSRSEDRFGKTTRLIRESGQE